LDFVFSTGFVSDLFCRISDFETMSRYYPGFFAALAIILLRIAIGWHFLFEGWEKFTSTASGKEPFSAEIYLRNAAGPLAPYFRGMVPDVNGLTLLDPTRLKASWSDEVTRVSDHFHFNQEQKTQAQKALEDNLQWADYWFHDPENDEKRQKYYHDLGKVQQIEADPNAIAFQRERAAEARRGVDADRRAITAPLVERGNVLRSAIVKLATADQIMSAGAPMQWTSLDYINQLTIFGLIAIGVCLMAGFLTSWAALGAATFLAMIYLSMPPWPGVPPNPRAEGHYWIVSKNLIELLACLVVATTPSGHWIGLDALFFGARRRRRLSRAAAEAQGTGDARGRQRQPVRAA
jgi:uncharacterized membrane protein YphA (DoxX/SURF4 family)